MSNKLLFDMIISIALADAEKIRRNAGYSGSWTDGGADNLRNQAYCFRDGLAGRVPDSLKKYAKEAEKSLALAEMKNDPEWAEYERLMKKFEVG